MKQRHAHYVQTTGEIRTYSHPEGYNNKDKYLAIINIIWLTDKQAMLRGGKGDLDIRSMQAICETLKKHGAEQLIIQRKKGKKVPFGKLTESTQQLDTYLVNLNKIGKKMKLSEKQQLFMRLLPRLIDQAHQLGFEIRAGDLFRDQRVFGYIGEAKGYGNKNSCHKLKLAIDLNLFKAGQYLSDTESHRELGEWWEKQHELCSWGGHFNDGNHYSLTHAGSR